MSKGTYPLHQIEFLESREWQLPVVCVLPIIAAILWFSVNWPGEASWLRKPTILVAVLLTFPFFRKKILIGFEGKTIRIGSVSIFTGKNKIILSDLAKAIEKCKRKRAKKQLAQSSQAEA